jgi:putative aldouronate transport system permease protein
MLFDGGMIPKYIQYKNLHLLNSFWVYVVPGLVSVTYLLMVRTFFEGIPDSLEESAKLDGCGFFGIYTRIMLPLSKPVLAVVGLYTAVNHWNDWFSGAFYMSDTSKWPVQTVLQQMLTKAMNSQEVTNVAQALAQNVSNTTSDSLKMAAVVITTVPILCVYPFVQKYFAQGAMIGAVKG